MAVLPFILNKTKHLRIYIIFMLCIMLSWDLNQGKCVITDLEKKGKNNDFKDENEEFISKIARNLGLDMNKRWPRKAALILTILATAKLH